MGEAAIQSVEWEGMAPKRAIFMKYFTPELLSRMRSEDEEVSAKAHDDWERAITRYHRRWQKIKAAFPEGVRHFDDDQICLHDAEVLSMARQGDTFLMVLQPEPPSSSVVLLTFTLEGE